MYCYPNRVCNLNCLAQNACRGANLYSTDDSSSQWNVTCNGTDACIALNNPSSNPTTDPTVAPTLAPSNAPTLYPTLSPTTSEPTSDPTANPSTVPTIGPTVDPSRDPTSNPSSDPTKDPTHNPTGDPTSNPTGEPTSNPTTDPTTDPTSYASSAPTFRPTSNPTVCRPLTEANRTIHGHSKSAIAGTNEMNYTQATYIANTQEILCHNITTCWIDCSISRSCIDFRSTIESEDLSSVFFDCEAGTSCDSLIINISNSSINSMTIWCNQSNSCASLIVDIGDANIHRLNIYCFHLGSCGSLNMQSVHAKVIASIFCFQHNSCSKMFIRGDSGLFLNINMFRYSIDVNIIHPNISNVNTVCIDDGNDRMIRYDTQNIPNERELMRLAAKEYTSQWLPCDGNINIDCSSDIQDINRKCVSEYTLKPFDLRDIIDGGHNDINCYWLDISDVLDVRCNGNCDEVITYNEYHKWLEYLISFQFGDVEITDDLTSRQEPDTSMTPTSLCNTYFATISDTENTLQSMDSIFEHVLSFIESSSNYELVHDVIQSPLTSLQPDGLSFVECHANFSSISIMMNLSISSTEEHETVDAIFDNHGIFVNHSEPLLSAYFNVNVTVTRDSPIPLVPDGVAIEYVISIISGIIIIALAIMIYQRRRRLKKLELLTSYLTNPLVIAISIGQYDEGRFSNLNGVKYDIQNIVQLFGDLFKYEISPEYNIKEDIKQYWTQEEIMNLFRAEAEILEDNVVEHKAEEKSVNNNDYDGLIVIISGHGVENYIVSSDYGKISKKAIHRLFSIDRPKSRTIPRLFLFDCCDGSEQRDTDWRGIIDDPEEESESSSEDESGKAGSIPSGKDTQPKAVLNAKDGDWYYKENNPDHKLAEIHASNSGFQAFMSSESGSYVISKLVAKIKSNYESTKKPNRKFLYQIMDEIQNELHDVARKQLPVCTYNNGTRYIKFKPNKLSISRRVYSESKQDEQCDLNNYDQDEIELEAMHKISEKSMDTVDQNIDIGDLSYQESTAL